MAEVTTANNNSNLNPASMPLPKSCYGAARSNNQVKLIVLHDSEIANGPSDLRTLHDALESQGLSVHAGNDGKGNCVRFVDDKYECFHVEAYNPQSLGLEQIGFATQTSWPNAQTDNAAQWIAYWAEKFGIPIIHSITHGVCRHMDLGESGGGHHDPGPGYPFNEVLKRANEFVGKITIKSNEGEESPNSVGSGVSLSEVEATAKAAAFQAYLDLPGLLDQAESLALKGERSLMNDQPLLPFIEQLSQASLRRFQSMPNGNFFGFYPDYFGGLEHRTPYWEINDIEILEGNMNLSDDSLATHVYVVGDSIGFFDGITPEDMAASSGVTTLFEAMASNFITGLEPKGESKHETLSKKNQVLNFLKRYGARPFYEEAPMVRSGYYEMFLSYQRFCMLWSKQFTAEFKFTYMPELFPGGLIALPEHGIQLFIEGVSHEFDYENGFFTVAELSSPAAMKGGPTGIHEGMIRGGALTPPS